MVNYIDRLEAAIEYIEANLSADLKVSTVARQVGYSPYHFHRVFRNSMGESIAEYIRKRRLTRAGQNLLETNLSISEIAREAMFDSQESFTRAFKKMFGQTPARYRRGAIGNQIIINPQFSVELLKHINEGVTMEPKYLSREKELAVGIGGSYGEDCHEEIAKLWQEFDKRMDEIKNVRDGYSLGLCMESHPGVELKEGDSFVYIAALPVRSVNEVPDGMHVVELPTSNYAVFTHSGPIKNITNTVKYIWGTWVPHNTEKVKKGPDFELYDHRFNPDTLEGDVDIYVPVIQ